MTTYTVDAAGSPRFSAILQELRKLSKRHGDVATYDATTKTWTVVAEDGDFQASNAVSFARSAGATVTEHADEPDRDTLQAERERLVARLAEIDEQLAD